MIVFNKLRFSLQNKAYPYPEEIISDSVRWGRVIISIFVKDNEFNLLDTQWDLSMLLDWFNENEQSIRHDALNDESLGIYVLQAESLAQAMSRLQERDFSDNQEALEDKWHDFLFDFRQKHSLRFALRGTDIPEIFIGINRGSGEISLCDESMWSYQFDMEDFLSSVHKEIHLFVNGK